MPNTDSDSSDHTNEVCHSVSDHTAGTPASLQANHAGLTIRPKNGGSPPRRRSQVCDDPVQWQLDSGWARHESKDTPTNRVVAILTMCLPSLAQAEIPVAQNVDRQSGIDDIHERLSALEGELQQIASAFQAYIEIEQERQRKETNPQENDGPSNLNHHLCAILEHSAASTSALDRYLVLGMLLDTALQDERYSFLTEDRCRQVDDALEELIEVAVAEESQRVAHLQKSRDQTYVTIESTNNASRSVFWVAHLAVALAFIAAGVELRSAYQMRGEAKKAKTTKLAIDLEGVAFRSSSLGATLIVFSLVFYFLYLQFAHPIQAVPM